MTDLWYLWPFAGLIALMGLYWLIRLLLDWLDYRKQRQITYTQTYGSVLYYGKYRPNFRTGDRP